MKPSTAILMVFVLAVLAGLGVLTFHAGAEIGPGGWSTLRPILPFVIGGLVLVGALAGGLMWLAFYSSRSGYDEPYDPNNPDS